MTLQMLSFLSGDFLLTGEKIPNGNSVLGEQETHHAGSLVSQTYLFFLLTILQIYSQEIFLIFVFTVGQIFSLLPISHRVLFIVEMS